jgi:hypothetical protein
LTEKFWIECTGQDGPARMTWILSIKPLWKIITEDDLKQFSDVLQDAVKQLQERMEA